MMMRTQRHRRNLLKKHLFFTFTKNNFSLQTSVTRLCFQFEPLSAVKFRQSRGQKQSAKQKNPKNIAKVFENFDGQSCRIWSHCLNRK